MKKLLITGFDPFGGANVNPAWLAVEELPNEVGEFELCKLLIPTVFEKAPQTVIKKAREVQPDVILCIGQAGGREAVTPERFGVNIRDARIADNEGNQPRGVRIAPDGPAAYFATVPVEAMAQAARDAGCPATVSNSAGAFVCNDTLYSLLHYFAGTEVKVGFIHVPYLPKQGTPSLPLEKTVAALEAMIKVCEGNKPAENAKK